MTHFSYFNTSLKYSVTLEIGLLLFQPFTNRHFHFLIVMESTLKHHSGSRRSMLYAQWISKSLHVTYMVNTIPTSYSYVVKTVRQCWVFLLR